MNRSIRIAAVLAFAASMPPAWAQSQGVSKDEIVIGTKFGYDIYNNPPGHHEEEGTDFAAIENDEISITPVHLELTDTPGLEELGAWDVDGLLRNGLD